MRGLVVELTADQKVRRARYLAGEMSIDMLDFAVRKDAYQQLAGVPDGYCPDLFYRLEFPNGGTDPTAPDPAARWSRPGSKFVNRTLDCFAGMCWVEGFDRLQEKRAARVWEGRLNCDSMIIEATHYRECFEILPEPELGSIVAYESVDYDHDGDRDRVGHTGVVVRLPRKWDPSRRECWEELGVVDCASRGASRSNKRTTGLTWYGNDKHGRPKDSKFLRMIMKS